MKRSTFIRRASMATAAWWLLPTFSGLAGCDRKPDIGDFKGKVAVIGAGAAGLYAAWLLHTNGVTVEVYEATTVHGGRVRKHNGFMPHPIDDGAQWLHGNKSVLKELADNKGEVLWEDNTDPFKHLWYNDTLIGTVPTEIQQLLDLDDRDWNTLPDVSLRAWATAQGFSASALRFVEALASEAGTSADRLSVREWVRYGELWTSGDADFLFQRSYYDLLHDHIARPIQDRIRYNTPITRVQYSAESGVTLTASDGTRFNADTVIVTVPLPILKAGDIVFDPPLPTTHTQAIGRIGMDPGFKVFLKFNTKFFQGTIAGGSVCGNYLDGNWRSGLSEYTLVCLLMGSVAEGLQPLGHEGTVSALLAELDTMFGGAASAAFVGARVVDWGTEPYIRGAYSYPAVGMGDAREAVAAPVSRRLYFAGEAFNTRGNASTVHGAAESAYDQVLQMVKDHT